MWTPYKNRMGARRHDGLYLRRAWNWYPWGIKPFQLRKGWDLNKGHTLLGTFPDQPLEQVLVKVDALLPPGTKHPVGPWKHQVVKCSECSTETFLDGRPWSKIQVICGCCAASFQTRCHDTSIRELELLPEQKLSTFTEVPYVPAVRN